MKVGYELELLAPPNLNRAIIAQSFAQELDYTISPYFHRESERWPGGDPNIPFYCLTKAFRLSNNQGWQLSIVNDMTIEDSLERRREQDSDWYHILAKDIETVELIKKYCDPQQNTVEVLKPIADLSKVNIEEKNGVYSILDNNQNPICGAHSFMTDRSRICELVTAPMHNNNHSYLKKILSHSEKIGCTVPKEGAFHIHFDGAHFSNSKNLLRAIRYFYVWSDVLKMIIPPNPHCTRLGEYNDNILNYAFNLQNEEKGFEEVVQDLKQLRPVKYCDFNFTNILIGNPNKYTFEVRVIPMMMNAEALAAASDLYTAFIHFILKSDIHYPLGKKAPNNLVVSELMNLI